MNGLMFQIFFVAIITSTRSQDFFRRTGLGSVDFESLQPKVPLGHSTQHSHHNDERYNCVCFDNKTKLPVSEALSNSTTNLERLVVYLYKDTNSNTLQLFTPNKETQAKFPDLGIDEGDLLKIGFQTVDQVFNTNTNAVQIKTTTNDDTLPEIIPHDENVYVLPYTENTVEVNEENAATTTAPLQIMAVPSKSINTDNSNDNADASDVQEDEDTKENSQNKGETSGDENQENLEGLAIVESPKEEEQSENSSEIHNNNSPQDLSSVVDNSLTSQTPSSEFINFDLNYLSPYTYDTNNFPDDQKTENVGNTNIQNQQQDTSKPELKQLLNTISVEGYNEDKNPGNKNVVYPAEKNILGGNEYVTFDKWFTEQMQKIKKTGKAPNKLLDLSALKHLIEKTLFENGLYVTNDGVLTDSKANALDVSNLKLRPILIGDSLTYDNIFADVAKYELPSTLPYLESVLVTSITPPKILGVIPLRKTFVPRVSYRAGLDYWDWKKKNNFRDCKSLECILQKLNSDKKNKSFNIYQSRGYKKQRVLKISRKTGKTVHRYGNNLPKGNSNQNLRTQVKSKLTNPKDELNYRLNLRNVLKAFQSTLFNTPKNSKPIHISKPINSEPRRSDYEIILEEEPTEDDDEGLDLPGFRIIGGLPATSSGTPVSSKGRSGVTYY